MKESLVVIFFILSFTSYVKSQNTSIQGYIVSDSKEPIQNAVISVFNLSNKKLQTGFTDSTGFFYLVNLTQSDSAIVEVSELYHKKEIRTIKLSFGKNIMDTINLEMDNVLNEVVITTAVKPYSTNRQTDRLVVSLNAETALVKNNTMLGIMRNIPTLSYDEMKGITMLGKKDVSVYINGKKSRLSETSLMNYLGSMPASNIKDIELITSPGATFNTGAHTGIINITLRRPEDEGLKGTISAIMWQTHYNKQLGNINLQYNKGNLLISSNLGVRNVRDWSQYESTTYFKNSTQQINETGQQDNRRPIYIANIDIAYELNSKHTIGSFFSTEHSNEHPNSYTESSYLQQGNSMIDSIISSAVDSDNKNLRFTGNLNYTYAYSKSTFKLDMDYLYNQIKQNSIYKAEHLVNNTVIPLSNYKQHSPQNTNLWSIKGEYEYLLDKHEMLTGVEGYITMNNNTNEYNNTLNASSVMPYSEFDYDDRGISGYISHRAKWTDKFSSKIGLRLEHIFAEGTLKLPYFEGNNKNYTRLLPSLSLTFNPSSKHSLWYSLSTRNRFHLYSYLNPFKVYSSEHKYSTGNPYLKPSKTIYQEFGYFLKSKYLFNISYYITKDDVWAFSLLEENSIVEVTKPVNYGKVQGVDLLFSINQAFFNRTLHFNARIKGNYTNYKNNIPQIRESKDVFYGEININGTLIPPKLKTWRFTVEMQYRTPYSTLVSKDDEHSMRGGLNISKRINDFNISVYGFYSFNYLNGNFRERSISHYITNDYESYSISKGENKGIQLTLRYQFGNKKVKNKGQRDISSSSYQDRLNDIN